MARITQAAASLIGLLVFLSSHTADAQTTTGSDPTDPEVCDAVCTRPTVCLFEATGRLGGRIYSVRGLGPNKDLTLDMGAYRYMPLVQPIITNMIENNLQLPHRLYQPGVPDYKVILTPNGSNAGFATWVTALAEKAVDMGLELNYNSKIVKLTSNPDGSFTLTTAAGRNITAMDVVLNLPSRPLHRLLQASGLPRQGVNQELLEAYQVRATKLYLYYDNAWWLANGLNNVSLAYNLPWNTTQPPVVPIIGRSFDAQAKCATMQSSGTVSSSSISAPQYVDYYYQNANNLNTQMCYGFFQLTYTADGGTTNISHMPLDYLVDYASPTPGPDGIALPYTVWDNTTAMGAKLLADSHTELMAWASSTNQNLMNADALPTIAIVALWDPSVDWSGGAWHSNKTIGAFNDTWSSKIIKPFDGLNLYVADEAWGTQPGWSEGSLVMAEAIVTEYFGATTPYWMNASTPMDVAFGPTFTDYENAAQGGGAGIPLSPGANLTSTGIQNMASGVSAAPSPHNY